MLREIIYNNNSAVFQCSIPIQVSKRLEIGPTQRIEINKTKQNNKKEKKINE